MYRFFYVKEKPPTFLQAVKVTNNNIYMKQIRCKDT